VVQQTPVTVLDRQAVGYAGLRVSTDPTFDEAGDRDGDSPAVPVRGTGGSTPGIRRSTLRHSGVELVLTFLLLFGVATIARWVTGPSVLFEGVPEPRFRLLVIGVLVGLLVPALMVSPLGRRSGAHMNPAISLAMWRFGNLPGAAVVPYVTAQLAGSFLGVLAARGVWGGPLSAPGVAYSALQPTPDLPAAALFLAEASCTAVIVLLVGVFLSARRLTRYTPHMVGVFLCLSITLLGTSTGPGINPARQFGPALAAGQFHFLWVYLLAPMLGAAVASLAWDALVKPFAASDPGHAP
jgi:glycerol uptake facilitator protein/aquaporin Z